MSPSARRISPSARRMSPGHKGERHMGQRLSPRRMSPNKPPPTRNLSPGRRGSPNRGHSPRAYARYSPSRIDKHMENLRPAPDKDVRPAYDPIPQAQSQPMYSGGYPPRACDNAQFAASAPRPAEQRPTWQDRDKAYNAPTKPLDERRDPARGQKFEPPRGPDYPRGQLSQPEGKMRSPCRVSRSPSRRERSPIRDRYRRHSPSPRSPRRSWALEKRRSPESHEPPPPPTWPIKEAPYSSQARPSDERPANSGPVWDKPYGALAGKESPLVPRKDDRRSAEREDRRYLDSPSLPRWEPQKGPRENRDASPRQPRHERYPNQREPNCDATTSPTRTPPDSERRDQRGFAKQERDEPRHKGDDYRQRAERKQELRIGPDTLNREIEDVFKRAAELTKKTEEYQRKRSEKMSYGAELERRRPEKRDAHPYEYEAPDRTRSPRPSNLDPYGAPSGSYGRGPAHARDPREADLDPKVQYKRDKAIDEIVGKMLHKFAPELKGKMRDEVEERLKLAIEPMILDMFGDKDVAFIEIVIKFEDRYNVKDLERIFDRVMSEFPSEFRRMKRPAQDETPIPAKILRNSPSPSMKRDHPLVNTNNWNFDIQPPPALFEKKPLLPTPTMMVPIPYASSEPVLNPIFVPQPHEGHYLFLCKDNFQAFNDTQAGVQNKTHYEVWTRDEQSKEWLMNLNFKDFPYFKVLIYTAEERWYERAAIWLPGHPRKQNPPPLVKLKLQNRALANVNVDKWKLVKQIVTAKGTRLYVDMPPSSARALERQGMSLSYELQKVHVFLKAVAVDKDAFDAGLAEKSITFIPDLQKQNSSMPAIDMQEASVIKLCLAGSTVTLTTACKIKDALINNIYKYLQTGGTCKTDFTRYGFSKPGYFCVVPENEETRAWVNTVDFGRINGQCVTVWSADEDNARYFTMFISVPYESHLTPKTLLQKLKLSNRGVKGLKFHMWKNGHVYPSNMFKTVNYRVDVDIESVETLFKMKFTLDYLVNGSNETVYIKPEDSMSRLKDIIGKFRAEARDSLDVTNMDISTSDEDEVVCLD
ncbi:unnamed protein product, partial [Iphiclides podalirius]